MVRQLAVSLTGFRADEVKDYVTEINGKGMAFDSCLKQTTDVLVANHTCTKKWIAAVKAGIPVVGVTWLRASEAGYTPNTRDFSLKRLSGLRISSTRLSLTERQRVEELCRTNGAEYSPSLDDTVAVLLTSDKVDTEEEGGGTAPSKLAHARRLGVPIATLGWLHAVVDESLSPPDWKEFPAVPLQSQDRACIEVNARKTNHMHLSLRKMNARQRTPLVATAPAVGVAKTDGVFRDSYFEANACCLPLDVQGAIFEHGGVMFPHSYSIPPDENCTECGGVHQKKYVSAAWVRRSATLAARQPCRSGVNTHRPAAQLYTVQPSEEEARQQDSSKTAVSHVKVFLCGDNVADVAQTINTLGGAVVNSEVQDAVSAGNTAEALQRLSQYLPLTHVVLPHMESAPHMDRRGQPIPLPPPVLLSYVTHLLPALPEQSMPRFVSAEWLSQSKRHGVFIDPTPFGPGDVHCYLRDFGVVGGVRESVASPLSKGGDTPAVRSIQNTTPNSEHTPQQRGSVGQQYMNDIAPGRSFVIPATPLHQNGNGAHNILSTPIVPGENLHEVIGPTPNGNGNMTNGTGREMENEDATLALPEAVSVVHPNPPPELQDSAAEEPSSNAEGLQREEESVTENTAVLQPPAEVLLAPPIQTGSPPPLSMGAPPPAGKSQGQATQRSSQETNKLENAVNLLEEMMEDEAAEVGRVSSPPETPLIGTNLTETTPHSSARRETTSRKSRKMLGLPDSPLLKPFRHISHEERPTETTTSKPQNFPLSIVEESQLVRHAFGDSEEPLLPAEEKLPAPSPHREENESLPSRKRRSQSEREGSKRRRSETTERERVFFAGGDPPAITLSNHRLCSDIADASYVIAKPVKSVPFLGGVAGGKWVLHQSYISDSNAAGRWLPEAGYEWSEALLEKEDPGKKRSTATIELIRSAAYWRDKGGNAFAQWSPSALVGDAKTASYYTTILQSGGARVIQGSSGGGGGGSFSEAPKVIIYASPTSVKEVRATMERYPTALHAKADVLWMKLVDPQLVLHGM